jgi:hypothetical protein
MTRSGWLIRLHVAICLPIALGKGRGVPAEALRALRNSLRMGAEIDL